MRLRLRWVAYELSRSGSANVGLVDWPSTSVDDAFLSFRLLRGLRLYATCWVMINPKCLYNTFSSLRSLFLNFLLYLAAISDCDFWVSPSWVYPNSWRRAELQLCRQQVPYASDKPSLQMCNKWNEQAKKKKKTKESGLTASANC